MQGLNHPILKQIINEKLDCHFTSYFDLKMHTVVFVALISILSVVPIMIRELIESL